MNVIETVNKIKEVALSNSKREEEHKTRYITEQKIGMGEAFRQGDLYMVRVKKNHPIGQEVHRNQIADGVSIGARHILFGKFKVYEGSKPKFVNEMYAKVSVGYAFDVEENTVLKHPEHDNYVFTFPSRWQVLHQVDLRTLSRVAD